MFNFAVVIPLKGWNQCEAMNLVRFRRHTRRATNRMQELFNSHSYDSLADLSDF